MSAFPTILPWVVMFHWGMLNCNLILLGYILYTKTFKLKLRYLYLIHVIVLNIAIVVLTVNVGNENENLVFYIACCVVFLWGIQQFLDIWVLLWKIYTMKLALSKPFNVRHWTIVCFFIQACLTFSWSALILDKQFDTLAEAIIPLINAIASLIFYGGFGVYVHYVISNFLKDETMITRFSTYTWSNAILIPVAFVFTTFDNLNIGTEVNLNWYWSIFTTLNITLNAYSWFLPEKQKEIIQSKELKKEFLA